MVPSRLCHRRISTLHSHCHSQQHVVPVPFRGSRDRSSYEARRLSSPPGGFRSVRTRAMDNNNNGGSSDDDEPSNEDDDAREPEQSSESQSQSELFNIRVAKARLQHAHDRAVLKRKPRYLPFQECRRWARAMWMQNEIDWEDWLNDGRRNPYVPSQPDVVYADSGFSTWHDFLNGPFKD
mmetsp:Transcript_1500/g.3335  ORF Transcript_1500/g.3335 Transcript_1500/m.3335 type:complete len:180 (-) Transcript_1500:47-586(-)